MAVAMANIMLMVALTPMSAILPTIAKEFGAEITEASWVISAFLLTMTSLLLTFGRLGDLYGHQRVFLWGAIVYTVAGVLGGLSQNVLQLVLLRAIQGIGMAMIAGNSLAIVANVFPGAERGRAVGVAGMAASVGGLIGVLVGTVFAQYISWRWLFFLLLPLGLASMKGALDLRLGYRPSQRLRLDIPGALILGVALLAFSLSASHLHSGESSYTAGWLYHGIMVGGGFLLLGMFLLVEMRVPQPLVELRFLRHALFATSIVANGILHMTMMASTFLIPFMIERGLGLTPLFTAGMIATTTLTNMVAAPLSGWIYDKKGWRFLPAAAMLSISGGLVALGLLSGAMAYWGFLIVGSFLGLGLGFFMTPNNTIIMGVLPANYRGFAAGMLETSRQLGHVVGVTASSAVVGAVLSNALPLMGERAAYTMGFQQATLVAGIGAFLGVLVSLVSSRFSTRGEEPVPEHPPEVGLLKRY